MRNRNRNKTKQQLEIVNFEVDSHGTSTFYARRWFEEPKFAYLGATMPACQSWSDRTSELLSRDAAIPRAAARAPVMVVM